MNLTDNISLKYYDNMDNNMIHYSAYISAASTAGLVILAEIPIYFVFAIPFVVGMLEAKKIQKTGFSIISNLISAAITGWGVTSGVKHLYPEWFIGEGKLFVMLVTTVSAFGILVYLFKNETLGRWADKYINRNKTHDYDNDGDSSDM